MNHPLSIKQNDKADEENIEEEMIIGDNRIRSCVVWTQIPILTWIMPIFGHVGICDSNGCVHDFQGPYYVGHGKMLFGDPRQRWVLNIDPRTLDSAIAEVSNDFKLVPYNLLCSNCHYFVASVLDRAGYQPMGCFKNWHKGATGKIAWGLVLHGRSLTVSEFLLTWIPFLIFYGIIILIIVLILKTR